TLEDTVHTAQLNLAESGSDVIVTEVVVDKGYHSAQVLETFAEHTPYRLYASEPKLPAGRQHVWTNKPEAQRDAVSANRRRSRGERGRRLQRLRSERVERSFAHVCETGGARRTWLRDIANVRKRYLMAAVAHNLGRLMRVLFGMGTPRGLQKAAQKGDGLLRAPQLAQIAAGRLRNVFQPLWNPWISISHYAPRRASAAA